MLRWRDEMRRKTIECWCPTWPVVVGLEDRSQGQDGSRRGSRPLRCPTVSDGCWDGLRAAVGAEPSSRWLDRWARRRLVDAESPCWEKRRIVVIEQSGKQLQTTRYSSPSRTPS